MEILQDKELYLDVFKFQRNSVLVKAMHGSCCRSAIANEFHATNFNYNHEQIKAKTQQLPFQPVVDFRVLNIPALTTAPPKTVSWYIVLLQITYQTFAIYMYFIHRKKLNVNTTFWHL